MYDYTCMYKNIQCTRTDLTNTGNRKNLEIKERIFLKCIYITDIFLVEQKCT